MAAVASLFQEESVGVHEGALLTNSVCFVAKVCAVCVSLSPLQLACTCTGLMEGIMSIRAYRPLSKLRNRFARITHRWQKKARQVYEVCGTRDACQLLRRKLHESF